VAGKNFRYVKYLVNYQYYKIAKLNAKYAVGALLISMQMESKFGVREPRSRFGMRADSKPLLE